MNLRAVPPERHSTCHSGGALHGVKKTAVPAVFPPFVLCLVHGRGESLGGQFVFCGGVIRAWCNRIKPMLPKLPHCSRNLTDRLLTWSQGTATHEPCNSELSPGTARRWTDLPVAPATAPNV